MKRDEKISEAMMDAATGEALSGLSSQESADYQRQLATASDDEKRFDRGLKETVARMAGAAPYMKPREELRGRILQATAPTGFRMEDYRKANRETGRFYKWGFYAAMAFLCAGAWFNISLKNKLTSTQQAALATINKFEDLVKSRDVAMSAMVNPRAREVSIKSDKGAVTGKAYLNPADKTAVVVLPEGFLPVNVAPQVAVSENGASTNYSTIFVTAPRSAFSDIPQTGIPTDKFALQNLKPDNDTKVFQAGFGK